MEPQRERKVARFLVCGSGHDATIQHVDDEGTCQMNHPDISGRRWHMFADAKGRRFAAYRCPESLEENERLSLQLESPGWTWQQALREARAA